MRFKWINFFFYILATIIGVVALNCEIGIAVLLGILTWLCITIAFFVEFERVDRKEIEDEILQEIED